MSLNFIKSLFFIPKLLKKITIFIHIFVFKLLKKKSLQSLRMKKELFKVYG